MEDDSISLAELANKTSANVKQTAKVTQDILNAGKTKDLALELLLTDLSYFADACNFLSVQLSKASSLDSFVAVDKKDTFWKSVRGVLQLWLQNTEQNLETMQKDQKQRAGWMGWLVARHDASPRPSPFNLYFAKVGENTKAHMQDAQMITSLFNIQSEMRVDWSVESRHRLSFLSSDLEWKAIAVQTRISRIRYGSKLPAEWSRTHEIIAEVAMNIAAQANAMSHLPGYSQT